MLYTTWETRESSPKNLLSSVEHETPALKNAGNQTVDSNRSFL